MKQERSLRVECERIAHRDSVRRLRIVYRALCAQGTRVTVEGSQQGVEASKTQSSDAQVQEKRI